MIWAGLSSGADDILITTSQGQSIRFKESDVRPMGRTAGGVTGIKLSKENDRVVGTVVITNGGKDTYLMVVSNKGYGKRTPVKEYKIQNRGGSGILTYKVTAKTGELVDAREQQKSVDSDLLIATASGKIIRLSSSQIPQLGRATIGVRLIRLDEKDKVTGVAALGKDDVILNSEEED